MSKGRDAIGILQQYFGERVDPSKALTLMMAKIGSQNELLGRLKDLCCAMAFDRGTFEGTYLTAPTSEAWDELAAALFALPCVELRAETVEPNHAAPSRVKLT